MFSLKTNYLSFEIACAVNGFKNAVDIIRCSNIEYDEKNLIINQYANELLATIVFLKDFAVDFNKEYQLTYDDVNDYMDRLYACLKSLKYLCSYYELDINTRTSVSEEIIALIELILKRKQYYSGYSDEEGNAILEDFYINHKLKKQLKCKKKQY